MKTEIFEALKNRIQTDKDSEKINWYDGEKQTDPQGNWYGWTDGGNYEYLFYAGMKWERHIDYKGEEMITEG